MNHPHIATKEIQNLITANFERMAAFEQAAFNAATPQLQQYFEEKANQSEQNMEELNAILCGMNENSFDAEQGISQNLLGTTNLFTGQKNMNTLLKHIQYLEKSVLGYYKKGMGNLQGISQIITQVLSKHYTELQASHLYSQSC